MATAFWYRISNQFEITIHDVPDISLKQETKYWIEVVNNNRIHTTSISNNEFVLYDYNIFNNVIDPIQLIEQNLTCAKIYDRITNTWGTVVCFEIEDCENIKRVLEFGSARYQTGKDAEEAILSGISFMKMYGSNKTWEIIELRREIKFYKNEIETLNEKIKSLQKEIESKNI